MTVTIARARRDDAFACAALRLQMGLESGGANRRGFVAEYADYFLANYDLLPTWIASSADGAALGMVETSLFACPPALSDPGRTLLYVTTVFVTPQARGNGVEERMLRAVAAWADVAGMTRTTAHGPGDDGVSHPVPFPTAGVVNGSFPADVPGSSQ